MGALRGSSSPWLHEPTVQVAPKHWLNFGAKPQGQVLMRWAKGQGNAGVGNGGMGVSYEVLGERLGAGQWQLADEETRRLLILLSGEAAVKRKYIFFSEVQFIPAADLSTIDGLWRSFSGNRFGYSVQRRIWKSVSEDFTNFFKRVGWMKRLDTEMEQYTYRSFPSEFMWQLTDSTPEGHLPLTNALRGTQLLASIFAHPAFDSMEEEEPSKRPHVEGPGRQPTFMPDYKL